jgi:hypothetical protein
MQGHGRGLINALAEFFSRAVIHPGWAGGICFPQHDHFLRTIELQIWALDDVHLAPPFDEGVVVVQSFFLPQCMYRHYKGSFRLSGQAL